MCESDIDELYYHNRDENGFIIIALVLWTLQLLFVHTEVVVLRTVGAIAVIRFKMMLLLQNWCGRGVVVMMCVDVAEKMELLWCEDMNELLKWF